MNRKRISRDQSSLTPLIFISRVFVYNQIYGSKGECGAMINSEFERFGRSGTGKRALTPLASFQGIFGSVVKSIESDPIGHDSFSHK